MNGTDVNLFAPFKLGNLELPNRVVMAPIDQTMGGVRGMSPMS